MGAGLCWTPLLWCGQLARVHRGSSIRWSLTPLTALRGLRELAPTQTGQRSTLSIEWSSNLDGHGRTYLSIKGLDLSHSHTYTCTHAYSHQQIHALTRRMASTHLLSLAPGITHKGKINLSKMMKFAIKPIKPNRLAFH